MSLKLLPDPDKLRAVAIERTLEQFDFAKVRLVLAALDWRNQEEAGPVPTVEELRQVARELLERAWDDECAPNCDYCHGGLRATRIDGCLTLQFVLEESLFVTAVDLLMDSAS